MRSDLFQSFDACDHWLQMGVPGAKMLLDKLFREMYALSLKVSGTAKSILRKMCVQPNTSGVQGCCYLSYLPPC